MASFRFTFLWTAAFLRLKVSSCFVSAAALSAAFFTSSASESCWGIFSRSFVRKLVYPNIAPRILLKSCAIPPASLPTVSIFWACTSCSDSRFWLKIMLIWSAVAMRKFTNSSSSAPSRTVKKFTTASTSPPTIMGMATAAFIPQASAIFLRGKLASFVTSGTQAVFLLSHTLPGRPSPFLNLKLLDCAAKASIPCAVV